MHKVVQYRNKCIGCGICYEQQPDIWRMSKKDGKATLLKATGKKDIYVLEVSAPVAERAKEIAAACPVRIIKVA